MKLQAASILALLLASASGRSVAPRQARAVELAPRKDTCGSRAPGFSSCGADFPDDFCCGPGRTCMGFNDNKDVVCCPSGNCQIIAPTSCNPSNYNATTSVTGFIHLSEIPDSLPKCGEACCPPGFTCLRDSQQCVLDSAALSSSVIAAASTAAATLSSAPTSTSTSGALVTSHAAAASDCTSQCNKYPVAAVMAGFFPGIIGGVVATAIIMHMCVNRDRNSDSVKAVFTYGKGGYASTATGSRHTSKRPTIYRVFHGSGGDSHNTSMSSFGTPNDHPKMSDQISEPIFHGDITRTDFIRHEAPPAAAAAARNSQAVDVATPSPPLERVRSLFSGTSRKLSRSYGTQRSHRSEASSDAASTRSGRGRRRRKHSRSRKHNDNDYDNEEAARGRQPGSAARQPEVESVYLDSSKPPPMPFPVTPDQRGQIIGIFTPEFIGDADACGGSGGRRSGASADAGGLGVGERSEERRTMWPSAQGPGQVGKASRNLQLVVGSDGSPIKEGRRL